VVEYAESIGLLGFVDDGLSLGLGGYWEPDEDETSTTATINWRVPFVIEQRFILGSILRHLRNTCDSDVRIIVEGEEPDLANWPKWCKVGFSITDESKRKGDWYASGLMTIFISARIAQAGVDELYTVHRIAYDLTMGFTKACVEVTDGVNQLGFMKFYETTSNTKTITDGVFDQLFQADFYVYPV